MKNFNFIKKEQILYKSDNFFIVEDSFPVSDGHMLIISNSKKKDYFELNSIEHNELQMMIHKCKELIGLKYSPDGYNVGFNCGEAAGQTIFQFHCHVIPRYKGDMADPRGGVRHCISGKGFYDKI
jgi:diadenosine tetraphosphate (Ap4A) HIT family hydrolase